MTASTSPASPASRPLAHRIGEELVPNLAVLVALLAPALVWNRLPDPVASHWGFGGQPDAALGLVWDVLLLCCVTAAIAYVPIVAARFPMPRVQARLLVAVAGGGATLLAGVRVASVQANLDASTWEQAGALPATTLWSTAAATVAAACIGWAAAGSRPELEPPIRTGPVDVEVAAGEAVVWTGGTSGRTPVVAAVLLIVAAALGALFVPPELRTVLVIVLPLVALGLAALGQVRATVGPRGLSVALGWLGWPRLRVPIEDVAEVQVEDVAPMSYGGWGLRHVPGTTAVVIRRGEGLRIVRRSGRVFVVTVDDAARAAGVLLAHRDAVSTGA